MWGGDSASLPVGPSLQRYSADSTIATVAEWVVIDGQLIYRGATRVSQAGALQSVLGSASERSMSRVRLPDAARDSMSESIAGVVARMNQSGSGNGLTQDDPRKVIRMSVGGARVAINSADGRHLSVEFSKRGAGARPSGATMLYDDLSGRLRLRSNCLPKEQGAPHHRPHQGICGALLRRVPSRVQRTTDCRRARKGGPRPVVACSRRDGDDRTRQTIARAEWKTVKIVAH